MRYRKKVSIFQANLLYLILGILLLTVGSYVQNQELYSGLLITEFILILLPCLFFLKIKGMPIKETLRLNRIGLKQILLVIGITIFTYPLAVFFQAIFIGILNIFREVSPSTIPLPKDGIQYIISFFIIALAPGICEEVMFRGVMLDAYSRLGYKKSIIISAILFGVFHFNLLNLIGPTVLGIVFGIMAYKTNSIYSSIIGHTVNNGIALTIGFAMNRFQEEIDHALMETAVQPETISFALIDILMPFIFLALCFIIVRFMLNELEPFDKEMEEERFSYDSYMEDDFPMEDLNDYEDISYSSDRVDVIQYLPVAIIVFIFIYLNWIYIFL